MNVPDLTAALKIETTVELVDHEGLGIVVSELTSPEQADFFAGLVEGWSRFDTELDRGMQLAYIASEFQSQPDMGKVVAGLLRELAAHIGEVTG